MAARKAKTGGCVLILLDADTDCPRELAPDLLRRANKARSDLDIRVVLAKPEYEAWFLAAADSIAGQRGIAASTEPPDDPEAVTGAKEWLRSRMPRGRRYRETLDQPALTAIFNLDAARSAPSFDKLWRDVCELLRIAGRRG